MLCLARVGRNVLKSRIKCNVSKLGVRCNISNVAIDSIFVGVRVYSSIEPQYVGANYYSNMVLEFRVMPRIWFFSSSVVLIYASKYSGLGNIVLTFLGLNEKKKKNMVKP